MVSVIKHPLVKQILTHRIRNDLLHVRSRDHERTRLCLIDHFSVLVILNALHLGFSLAAVSIILRKALTTKLICTQYDLAALQNASNLSSFTEQ